MTVDSAALLGLAAICERAAPDQQRDLLDEAWDALGPIVNWSAAQARKFGMCVGAQAFESAALMLVPEGYGWSIATRDARFDTEVWPSGDAEDFWEARSKTPALALTAAALRAIAPHAKEDGQ